MKAIVKSIFALGLSLALVSCAENGEGSHSSYTFKDVVKEEPTCVKNGILLHECNEDKTKSYEETIPALGHDYSPKTLKWVWSEDNESASASMGCIRCDDVHSFQATISVRNVSATCEKAGATTREAKITYKGVDYTDNKVSNTLPLGHLWSTSERSTDGKYMVSHCEREGCDKVRERKIVSVILQAGQSNSVGYSYAFHLRDDAEYKTKYDELKAGVSNVYIRYDNAPFADEATSREKRSNSTFEKVRFGLGRRGKNSAYDGTLCFGPEVGVASYLSDHHVNDDFYIIKSATGASTLFNRWYTESSFAYMGKTEYDDKNLYVRFLKDIDEGMQELYARDDIYPEIVSLVWMQGENDGLPTHEHYSYLWNNFVNDLENELKAKGYLTPNGLGTVDGGIIPDYWGNSDSINGAKKAYADAHSKSYFIDVSDKAIFHTDLDADDKGKAHLDATSMMKLGIEMGKAVEKNIEDLNNPKTESYVPGAWNGHNYSSSWEGNGTEASPYLIQNDLEFMGLAYTSRYQTDYEGKFFKLTKDFDLSSYIDFGGISNYDHPFKGVFDGDNHTIKIRTANDNFAGLFRANAGTIKNFTLEGSILATRTSGNSANLRSGAVIGYSTGTVENVTNRATVKAKSNTVNPYHMGGIVGYLDEGKILSCTNEADVSASGFKMHTIGGIAGYSKGKSLIEHCKNYGKIYGTFETGGILGIAGSSSTNGSTTISDCENYGEVMGQLIASNDENAPQYSAYANGGIVGTAYSGVEILGSINHAKVSGKGQNASGTRSGIGGIVGKMFGTTVKNCTNEETGTIENSGFAGGGIVGSAVTPSAPSSNSVSTATIEGCKNFANVTSASCYSGGIIGYTNGNYNSEGKFTSKLAITVKNCQNGKENGVSSVKGSYTVGGVVGYMDVYIERTASSIDACSNYAEVNTTGFFKTINSAGETLYSVRLGGIAGMAYCRIANCDNYGKVSALHETYGGAPSGDVGTAENYRIGYLAGYGLKENQSLANCVNHYGKA